MSLSEIKKVESKDIEINKFYVNSISTKTIDLPDTVFLPELSFGGNSTGITYSTRNGLFTKIGNLVLFNLNVQLSSKGLSTGAASISLPSEFIANFQYTATVVPFASSIIIPSGYTSISALIQASSTQITLLYFNHNTGLFSELDDTNFDNTSGIIISGQYRTF